MIGDRAILVALSIVAAETGVPADDIRSLQRIPSCVRARHVVWWLAHRRLGVAQKQVGRHFQRHHTAVHYACQRVDREARDDRAFAERLDLLLSAVKDEIDVLRKEALRERSKQLASSVRLRVPHASAPASLADVVGRYLRVRSRLENARFTQTEPLVRQEAERAFADLATAYTAFEHTTGTGPKRSQFSIPAKEPLHVQ